jgi:type 1 glutamine amidotransferase
MADSEHPTRVNAWFVVGGRFHDFDYARTEILALIGEHAHVRTQVSSTWSDIDDIVASDFVVSYTCDVRPNVEQQEKMRAYVEGGGRWLALHGTNSALDFTPDGVNAPRCFPLWAETLGSQFVAHPPIEPYTVENKAPDHWLVQGIENFETDDELYNCEYHDRDQLEVHLATHWSGEAAGFVESDWTGPDDMHLVQYVRPLGQGAVLYNTLGHCRGHWDLPERTPYYPKIERGSWEVPQYRELLRRGLRWAMGHDS